MQAILYASTSSGNAPLRVKFDARSSYFIDATGTNYPCGPCNFTWQIRQGSNNIYGPETGTGSFEYRFGSKGTYFISVYVCRNGSTQDCAGNGTSVVVK
jgi:hypothetical protein